MADELKGWQRDPFGVHELRFFSDDGKPTLLVRDGDSKAYDYPPATEMPPPARQPDEERSKLVSQEATASKVVREVPIGAPAPIPGAHERKRPLGTDVPMAPVQPLFQRPDVDDSVPSISRATKVAYVIVLAAMAVSALVLLAIHLAGHDGSSPHASGAPATATLSTPTTDPTTTTTLALPSALKPSAAAAAADLISSWASGNQAEASSEATAPAVAALFAGHYTAGLVIDRGCSVAFSPIVCTYGPPGGAAPTDPIYEMDVVQAPGGWYVSSVAVNN